MNAGKRASVARMRASTSPGAAFKRQVVFRIGPEDWPLLEAAAAEHGSIQAALVAGLRALSRTPEAAKLATTEPPQPAKAARPAKATKPHTAAPPPQVDDPNEEIRARDAARILGLKTSTVSSYIRAGRLPGRYDAAPTWKGWIITRGAVEAYRRTRS